MHFDVMLGATLVEYFAGLTTEAKGETIPQRDGRLTYTTREPLGVVARLVAFNHPLLFAAAKMAADHAVEDLHRINIQPDTWLIQQPERAGRSQEQTSKG